MDQAECTNTGITSNEISDNVYGELCGFQNPNLIDNSDKTLEPYIGVDNDSYAYDNDESEIGNTDNCYQHVKSGDSNSTTHFVQIKSEPNICAKSSNDMTCTENEFIGSPRRIQNAEMSIKMEPITYDTYDPSCCMITDNLTHKSGKNSLHVHEQLDRLSSNSTNYAICIKYEPDSGAEGESHTSGSIASPSSSEVKIYDNALNKDDQQSCGPIKIEINDSHMRKDFIASTSAHHSSCSDNSVETFDGEDTCSVSFEPLHGSHKNVNIQEGKQLGEKPITPTRNYTKREYKCDVCRYSTVSSSLLKRHKKQHTENKPYKCDVCSYSTIFMSYLKRHKMQHTGEKPYKCDVCSYKTTRSNLLAEHQAKHTGEKSYLCDVCSYSTFRSSNLRAHKRKHTGEKPYKCDVCSYCTSRLSNLAEHKARHTGEKPYKCDVCSYCTISSSILKRHKARHTEEKRYTCDVCSFSTIYMCNLKRHKTKHTGDKSYKCDVCSFSTGRSRNLTMHKRKHTGEKLYKCDVCSYSTIWSNHLAEHKARHMGEKPYKCDVCSYSSVRSHDLVRHKRKHTGEKPYKCDVCSYCATESSELVAHKRKHTGEKTYKCDLCNFSTAWRTSLNLHKQQHTDNKCSHV